MSMNCGESVISGVRGRGSGTGISALMRPGRAVMT